MKSTPHPQSRAIEIRKHISSATIQLLQCRLLLMREIRETPDYVPDRTLQGRIAQLRGVTDSVAAWSEPDNFGDEHIGTVAQRVLADMAAHRPEARPQ